MSLDPRVFWSCMIQAPKTCSKSCKSCCRPWLVRVCTRAPTARLELRVAAAAAIVLAAATAVPSVAASSATSVSVATAVVASVVVSGSVTAAAATVELDPTGCWDECKRIGAYCSEFCCQPDDGVGNPSCWDQTGHYSYQRCCPDFLVAEPQVPPTLRIGEVSIQLYRGPSDHNQPRFTERTVEIALGLWFMRRSLRKIRDQDGDAPMPIEVGNVLGSYWPPEERLFTHYLPWNVVDLGDNGVDATEIPSFEDLRVLSISTLEHIGYDNEGLRNMNGFRVHGSSSVGLEAWVKAWDGGASLLGQLAREAVEFLVTFPIGFNPRLDSAVSRTPELRRFARVLRRVDASNRWEVDGNGSFAYHYDFRDTYSPNAVGLIFDPGVPIAYKRVFDEQMPPLLPLPRHPRFRFANAVCLVTNIPELLAP